MRKTLLLFLFAGLIYPVIAPGQSTASAPTTIQVTSRIVNVDVVVRDKNGRVVHGLEQQDFEIDEDGKPQTIEYFDEHTYNIDAASRMPKVAAGESRDEFSNVPAKGTVAGSINIVLFDLFDTPASDQLYARQQLLKFLETMPSGQQVALFVLGQHLQMVQDFTGSSDELIEAARQIRPRDFHLLESETQTMQANDVAANLANAAGANMTGHELGGGSGPSACSQNFVIRASSVVATFNELARATNGYPGRKNLFWMSDCFPMALGSQLDQTRFSGFTVVPGWRETANLVADSQIAVFPISLLGLETGGVPVSVNGVAEGNLLTGQGSTLAAQFQQRAAERTWVNDLARETGGEAFFGTNDFAGAIREGMGDESNYYALAYRPQNSDWNKQFRKVRVKLRKSGYTLDYQRGYFAFPNELSTASSGSVEQLDAALQPESPESTMLLLRAKVDMPSQPHGGVVVHSVLDVGNLGLVNNANGNRQGQVVVRLIAFKDNPGNAIDQPDAPPQASGVLNLNFDAAQYQAVVANGIAFTQQLNLPPGRYRLRLGVSDVVSHRIGTVDMPVTISGPTLKN